MLTFRPIRTEEFGTICKKTTELTPWRNLGIESDVMQLRIMSDQLREVWVADWGGESVGCIVFRRNTGAEILFKIGFGSSLAERQNLTHYAHWSEVADCSYISHVAVFNGNQGRGIGKKMLDFVKQEIDENIPILLCVSDTNPEARRFYEREGFVNIATRNNIIREGNIEHLMEFCSAGIKQV